MQESPEIGFRTQAFLGRQPLGEIDVSSTHLNRDGFQFSRFAEHPLRSASAGSSFLNGFDQVPLNYIHVTVPPFCLRGFGRELRNDEFVHIDNPLARK